MVQDIFPKFCLIPSATISSTDEHHCVEIARLLPLFPLKVHSVANLHPSYPGHPKKTQQLQVGAIDDILLPRETRAAVLRISEKIPN